MADALATSTAASGAGAPKILDIQGIAKSYGATVAVRRVSFDIEPGEIHALLGENGAGKSTIVKVLSGIVIPDTGTLTLDGRDYAPADPMAARAAFLSGPTFAKELAAGLPAALVVASRSARSAATVQEEFSTDRLRLYTSDDVIGIELGGALKNVCAIGAGIADGLGYGHNTRAALITRGLSEISRVGLRLGANRYLLRPMPAQRLLDEVAMCVAESRGPRPRPPSPAA